jgi:hypothetical protein
MCSGKTLKPIFFKNTFISLDEYTIGLLKIQDGKHEIQYSNLKVKLVYHRLLACTGNEHQTTVSYKFINSTLKWHRFNTGYFSCGS